MRVARSYAQDTVMMQEGPAFLRPWMLPIDAEMGVKGLVEPVPRWQYCSQCSAVKL